MQFSEFEFHAGRRGAIRLLASSQRLHAAILNCFPRVESGQGRVLWRVDSAPNGRTLLYVVSETEPDFTALAEEAGRPSSPGRSREYDAMLTSISVGERFRFRLTANTVIAKSAKTDHGKRGKLVPLVGDGQYEWLESRAVRHGFSVNSDGERSFQIIRRDSNRFRQNSEQKTRQIQLTTATFDGVLEVTDPVKFRNSLVTGIGRAKAYGCGLMTIARI